MTNGDLFKPVAEDPALDSFDRNYLQELKRVPELFKDWAREERSRRFRATLGAYVASVGVWFFAVEPGDISFFALLALGPLALLVLWFARTRSELWGKYQRACVATLVPFYGDLAAVSPGDLDLEDYRPWRLIPPNTGAAVTNQIRGSYQRVPFTVGSLYIMLHPFMRDGERRQSTAASDRFFNGTIAVFQLAQPCKGTTVFRTSGLFDKHFQRVRDSLDVLNVAGTELEILTSDPDEARELLPPRTLAALEEVQQTLVATALTGSFSDRRLVLLIQHQSGSLYEPDHGDDLRAQTEHVRCHLARLLGIVDTLQLAPVLKPGETIAPPRINPREHAFAFASRFFGWGRFWTFLTYALLVAICGWLGRDRVSDDHRSLAAFGAALGILIILLILKRIILGLIRRVGTVMQALRRVKG